MTTSSTPSPLASLRAPSSRTRNATRLACLAFAVAAIADAVTYSLVPAYNVASGELNPLARALGAGLPAAIACKALGLVTILAVLWIVRRMSDPQFGRLALPRSTGAIFLLLFATLSAYGAYSNVAFGWAA
jgi:hypothetical protein